MRPRILVGPPYPRLAWPVERGPIHAYVVQAHTIWGSVADLALDSEVRDKPDHCHEDVEAERDPRGDKRDGDRHRIEQRRDLALSVAADSPQEPITVLVNWTALIR